MIVTGNLLWRCVPLIGHMSLICLFSADVDAQEVYRETTYQYGASNYVHFSELDPDTKRVFTGEHASMATMKRHVPKPLQLDLVHATRAELSVEYWGGHIGTGGQRFRVNNHEWIDLPQPANTPAEPQRFYRVLHGNNSVPIPLEQLHNGENFFQFTAGKQVAYSNDWGFFWIYDFTVRIFYDAMQKPHVSGEVVSLTDNGKFGDVIRLEAVANKSADDIARVDFIGEYEDFDWDGDGVWREWQYVTHHGVMAHHLGTVKSTPWRIKHDARWLPDQSQAIRSRALITDKNGITYATAPIGLTQSRSRRGVRMIQPTHVPERWASRASKESATGTFVLTEDDLKDASFARLAISTWSGDVDDTSVHELRLNGERLASRFGEFHNYDLDLLEVPLDRLKQGVNEISTYSTFMGHMFEINWPGPALLIEYSK